VAHAERDQHRHDRDGHADRQIGIDVQAEALRGLGGIAYEPRCVIGDRTSR
jgi:hypothetical protein